MICIDSQELNCSAWQRSEVSECLLVINDILVHYRCTEDESNITTADEPRSLIRVLSSKNVEINLKQNQIILHITL